MCRRVTLTMFHTSSMETQSGTRTPLVDPFGREVEEWLRDAPATRTPYLADLVVPPVTGPVQRPDLLVDAPTEAAETGTPVETTASAPADIAAAPADDSAFRRPRDHGRHRSTCAPSFPEPPERLALRIEELAVEVSAQSGRPTLERIVVLQEEVRRRDEDLARLQAWEAAVADLSDPEVDAARAYARSVFEDLLAEAADEADRRDRAAARRAATTGAVTVLAPAPTPAPRSAPALVVPVPVAAPVAATGSAVLDGTDADRDEPARLVPSLLAVTPVSANTRPTPLVSPATGPTVIDRDAFAAVLRAHRAESDATAATAGTPVVFPEEHAAALPEAPAADAAATSARPGWWARVVAAVLRVVGRR